MEEEEAGDIFGTFLLLVLVIITSLFIVDALWYNPYRAEDAQTKCLGMGFDVYDSYKGFMRTKAYGVKCRYVDYTRKQIDIDTRQQENQDNLIVVV